MRSTTVALLSVAAIVALAGCSSRPEDDTSSSSTKERPTAVLPARPSAVPEAVLDITPPGMPAANADRQPAKVPAEPLQDFIDQQMTRLVDPDVLEQALRLNLRDRVAGLSREDGLRTSSDPNEIHRRSEAVYEKKDALLGPGTIARQARQLAGMLEVIRPERTSLIVVRLPIEDQALAADLVNSVVDSYMLIREEGREGRLHLRLKTLRDQEQQVTMMIAAADSELQMVRQKGVGLAGGAGSEEQLAALLRATTEAEIERDKAAATAAEIAKSGPITTPAIEREILSDPKLSRLQATEVELTIEVSLAENTKDYDRDTLKELKKKREGIRKEVAQRRTELLAAIAARQQRKAASSVAIAEVRLQKLAPQVVVIRRRIREAQNAAMELERSHAKRDALVVQLQTIRKAVVTAEINDAVASYQVTVRQAAAAK